MKPLRAQKFQFESRSTIVSKAIALAKVHENENEYPKKSTKYLTAIIHRSCTNESLCVQSVNGVVEKKKKTEKKTERFFFHRHQKKDDDDAEEQKSAFVFVMPIAMSYTTHNACRVNDRAYETFVFCALSSIPAKRRMRIVWAIFKTNEFQRAKTDIRIIRPKALHPVSIVDLQKAFRCDCHRIPVQFRINRAKHLKNEIPRR